MSLPQEPYTRIERYLAKFAGQDVDIPDHPITRIECYLDYIVTNGGWGEEGYIPAPNAGAHNGIFRGQSLGEEFTADQSAAIAGGSFEGLYIGDYWTINNVQYLIAGFDVFYNMGTPAFNVHHAVIVPADTMYAGTMNETAITTTGYYNSLMKTSGLDAALTTIESAFGSSHVLTRSDLFCTASADGAPSASAWYDTKIDLMTEGQVFGRNVWGYSGNGYNVGCDYQQFPLFALNPAALSIRRFYFLRDIIDASRFTCVDTGGAAVRSYAHTPHGVRPYFCIA